jgi:hypothetical protein
VRWCAGALVRWCAGALVRWCAGALLELRNKLQKTSELGLLKSEKKTMFYRTLQTYSTFLVSARSDEKFNSKKSKKTSLILIL